MTTRKLLIALAAIALYAVVLVTQASAEMRQLQVTLTNGQVLTVTVDVPAGTSPSSVKIPGLPAPVAGVVDLGPVATPEPKSTPEPAATPRKTPVPTRTPTPTAAPRETPTPAPTPANQQGGGAQDGGGEDRDGTGTGGGDGSTSAPPRESAEPGPAPEATPAPTPAPTDEPGARPRDREREQASAPPAPAPPAPTAANPTLSVAEPGAARIGVPNFFIDKFRIPPFLLPIYQAAGTQYGVQWQILAAINEIETDYGRNLNVSSAGALGWMQFMPPTWQAYGVDANGDGLKDPYNPVDAIFAAARYLKAAGAEEDIRAALWAYNHADWYVDSVLLRAQVIGGMPAEVVGSLTGLTQGRFPVYAKARYAGQLRETGKRVREGNAALVVDEAAHRRGIDVYAKSSAPVIAVNDGRIVDVGRSRAQGRYVVLQDVYGNTYRYEDLGTVARRYAAPRAPALDAGGPSRDGAGPARDAAPARAASSTSEPARRRAAASAKAKARRSTRAPRAVAPVKERLFAHPTRPNAAAAGGAEQEFVRTGMVDGERFDPALSGIFGLDRDAVRLKRLRKGSRVVAGTVLGRLAEVERGWSHVRFEIRPAGRRSPRIDPKPILDGWKLLESTAIYRAEGRNPFFGSDAESPSIGQILLMGKEELTARVLRNPHIDVYECGRQDIRAGTIDRRVLATLEFLAASGLRPTVTSLNCGHGYFTASGNVSHHSTGSAVDIAAVNGITITPETQGEGSITELTIERLLTLQGTMRPDQIISLMEFEGADNTLSMADHDDHIHIGWQPMYDASRRAVDATLEPDQWIDLIERLDAIDNPVVPQEPSDFALESRRASRAHEGE